jgi:hypothetical protein
MTEREAAWRRLRETKEAMDLAQAALDKAETEWHEACLEIDRIGGEKGDTK